MQIFQVIFNRGFTVKITIIDKKEDEEDEIIVKCSELDESLLELINSFKKGTAKLSFYQGSKLYLLMNLTFTILNRLKTEYLHILNQKSMK